MTTHNRQEKLLQLFYAELPECHEVRGGFWCNDELGDFICNRHKESIARLESYIQQREASLLAEVEERVVGENSLHGDGNNTAWEAGIDWRNQLREEQRHTLKAIRKERGL